MEQSAPQSSKKSSSLSMILFMAVGFAIMFGIIFSGLYSDYMTHYLFGAPNPDSVRAERMQTKPIVLDTSQLKTTPPPDDPTMNVRKQLEFWFRADALEKVKDGEPIQVLPDGSGKQHHIKQLMKSLAPLYKPSAMNGKPALRFDGNDDFFAIGNGLGENPYSIFVVWAKAEAGGQPYQRLYSSGTKGLDYQTNGACGMTNSANNGTAAAPPQIFKDIADKKMDMQNFYIGRLNANAVQFFAGDIAEMLIYTRKLSDQEVASVTSYLSTKYSIK